MSYEPFVAFGTRKGIVYELDTTYHLPKPTSTSPYTGLEIYGVRGFNIAQTNVRRIPHFDGDRIGLTQILPTTDVPSGTITVDGSDLNLKSVLGNVKKSTVGGIELMPMLTDQQGSEPEIGLLIYQAAKKTSGVQGYHVQFIPSTQAIPQDGSMGDNNFETTYQLSPSSSEKHLWGFALSTSTDGTESAGVIDGFAPGKPRLTCFLADGAEDEFVFDTSLQPTNTTYPVYKAVAGVVTLVDPADYTPLTTKITFDVAPASGAVIMIPHLVA